MGPTASRVISLWARALAQPPNTSAITKIAEETFFVFFMDCSCRIGLERAYSLSALIVFSRCARSDLHRFHLLDVLGVRGFRAAQRGLGRYPIFCIDVVKNVLFVRLMTSHFYI